MRAEGHILDIQANLLIPFEKRSPHIGPLTRGAFERLALLSSEDEYSYSPEQEGDITTLGHAGPEGARDINERATLLIQHFESCPLEAYQDEVGVWTIGWGHTGLTHKDGTVFRGRVISQAKADALFRYDMEQFEARVCAFVKVPLNDDQYGALVSFDFNTGGLGRSSLLVKLNDGKYQDAADKLLDWTKAGGKVLSGLVRRRRSERRLFMGEANYLLPDMAAVRRDERGDFV